MAFGPTTAVAGTSTIDWTQVTRPGPSAREGSYIAYDSARAKTVLFGGYEPAGFGKYDSDTWEFDGTPPNRTRFACALS